MLIQIDVGIIFKLANDALGSSKIMLNTMSR